MKISNALTILLTISTICVGQVSAKSGNGKGSGKPGGEEPPPADPSCAAFDSEFPSFAFTRARENRKGIIGYDFLVSNADGDCAVLIHSSDYNGGLELSYSQNGNEGVVVWRQQGNEYAGRKDVDRQADRIKLIRFESSNKEITTPLPLVSSEVAVVTPGSGETGQNSFQFVELSQDASKILVSHGDAFSNPGVHIESIREIDISSCSENCAVSPPLFAHDEFIVIGPKYSSIGDRIYFSSKFKDDSTDPLAGKNYLAFIERDGDSWTTPRYITLEGNNFHADVRYFYQTEVAIADLGNGPTEVLAFHYDRYVDGNLAYDRGVFVLQIIDVGSCSATGSEDCLSSGESSIFREIIDGKEPSFDDKYDARSMLFTTSTGNIIRHDLISGDETYLVIGHQADSGF